MPTEKRNGHHFQNAYDAIESANVDEFTFIGMQGEVGNYRIRIAIGQASVYEMKNVSVIAHETCVCVYAHVHVRACARSYVRAYARTCVSVCVCVPW